jgi:hypothetical protein
VICTEEKVAGGVNEICGCITMSRRKKMIDGVGRGEKE